jgi:hypothetical protein
METDYFILDKTSSSIIILSISLNKSRLDISPTSATKKKSCRESDGVFYLYPETQTHFAGEGMEIKNPADAAGGCRAFSSGCYPQRIMK